MNPKRLDAAKLVVDLQEEERLGKTRSTISRWFSVLETFRSELPSSPEKKVDFGTDFSLNFFFVFFFFSFFFFLFFFLFLFFRLRTRNHTPAEPKQYCPCLCKGVAGRRPATTSHKHGLCPPLGSRFKGGGSGFRVQGFRV